jgi:hypothetical protein
MIIRGSMNYDKNGRKRKKAVGWSRTKRREYKWEKAQRSAKDIEAQAKKVYPSAEPTEYTPPPSVEYKKEISKQYTVSIAYNKGAYQVIPKSEVKDIGK